MNGRHVISIVLNGHLPFVRHPERPRALEERWFFEALSGTYLPLLEVFDRLDADHIPFRMGISLSPTLCHMLRDEVLLRRYLDYTDRQIEFGVRELERTANDPPLNRLARLFYDAAVDKRVLFTGRYGGNILGIFDYYQKKGRIELLTTAATHGFLPFYVNYPEAIQAQMEVALASHRFTFSRIPQGFWLPDLGWSPELEGYLRMYNFNYTIIETHGVVLGEPFAAKGSFYPAKTPLGVFILARDYNAFLDITDRERGFPRDPVYRDKHQDVGYDLPPEMVRSFLEPAGVRTQTGYKYWAAGKDGKRRIYDPGEASERVLEHARAFLAARIDQLAAAGEYMGGSAISLCAYNADMFGRHWYEGPRFLEALFREGAGRKEIQFMNPAEYLYKQDSAALQTVVPEFSSWGVNGYAETWLDASNDWMYRHGMRALDRMIEMAERFPNNSGLKERALNQAAREILLVQSSDWPKMLYKQDNAAYARSRIEGSLRNFTTIYESLGSNYISTEWLTSLERRHNIFPAINYRVFRHKK